MRRKIKNITLTNNQEIYVRKNYRRMTTAEMGRNLSISQSKVFENMELMGLNGTVKRKSTKEIPQTKEGVFDIEMYSKHYCY